jgi:hypothetical protein
VVVLQPKEYEYLPELVVKIFEKRLSVKGPITQSLELSRNDPRKISSSIASVSRPSMEQLLESQRSRFSDYIV